MDDGMLNNYEILAPILEKHGLTALFAVCPALIDRKIPYIWRDYVFLLSQQGVHLPNGKGPADFNRQTRDFKKYIYDNEVADIYGFIATFCVKNDIENLNNDPLRFTCMTWPQIQELSKRGHQIASHTTTHRVLKFLSEEEKKEELQQSKHRLEAQLKIPIDTLVYPYGSMAEIDQATVNMAKEVGYKRALMNVRAHHLEESAFTQTRFAFPNSTDHAHVYAIASGYKFLFR
ncbi:MAG: polysaccharide deacetylase family protein [Spirosomataceae bacterium]